MRSRPRFRDPLRHQVGRTDREVRVADRLIQASAASPAPAGRPLRAASFDSPAIGCVGREQALEVEAPPHGRVDEGDRPVSGVHRADDEEVAWQGERLVGVLELPRSVPRYSSRKYSSPNTLARLARLISSMISTYGDAGLSAARAWPCGAADLDKVEGDAAGAVLVESRPEALEEVLVGVRRVELHHLVLAAGRLDEGLANSSAR